MYSSNSGLVCTRFWDNLISGLSTTDCRIMGGDINTVRHKADRSGNPPERLSKEKYDNFDILLLCLGFKGTWCTYNCPHFDFLNFPWTNKKEKKMHQIIPLDQFYISKWGQEWRGTMAVINGQCTTSDHLSELLHIKK
jgi:hypothetical protein